MPGQCCRGHDDADAGRVGAWLTAAGAGAVRVAAQVGDVEEVAVVVGEQSVEPGARLGGEVADGVGGDER